MIKISPCVFLFMQYYWALIITYIKLLYRQLSVPTSTYFNLSCYCTRPQEI